MAAGTSVRRGQSEDILKKPVVGVGSEKALKEVLARVQMGTACVETQRPGVQMGTRWRPVVVVTHEANKDGACTRRMETEQASRRTPEDDCSC